MTVLSIIEAMIRRFAKTIWPPSGDQRRSISPELPIESISARSCARPDPASDLPLQPSLIAVLELLIERLAGGQDSRFDQGRNPFLLVSGAVGVGETHFIHQLVSALHARGHLRKGHVVLTNREELVAGYIGQTGLRTRAICNAALDGVLIIDDGLSALSGGGRTFPREALDELVAFAAEQHDRILIVLESPSWRLSKEIKGRQEIERHIDMAIECSSPDSPRHCEFLRLFAGRRGLSLGDHVEETARLWIDACRTKKYWDNIWEMQAFLNRVCEVQRRRQAALSAAFSGCLDMRDAAEAIALSEHLSRADSFSITESIGKRIST